MKTIKLIIVLSLAICQAFGQDSNFKNLEGKQVIIAFSANKSPFSTILWKVHEKKIEYKDDKGLHDILMSEIEYIESSAGRFRLSEKAAEHMESEEYVNTNTTIEKPVQDLQKNDKIFIGSIDFENGRLPFVMKNSKELDELIYSSGERVQGRLLETNNEGIYWRIMRHGKDSTVYVPYTKIQTFTVNGVFYKIDQNKLIVYFENK